MILVDTSVLIDFFRGSANKSVHDFKEIIRHQTPFGISSVIYQEVLQGVKSKKEFDALNEYLSTQHFFNPRDQLTSYADAAMIFYKCRRSGITIHSTIDCLIAQTALEHKLLLLHNDKDFTAMAPVIGLRLYENNTPEL